MLQLNQLLGRFKNLTNTEKIKKELIVGILKTYNFPVKINQIYIVKKTIYIKTQPIIKTEILLKQKQIIEQIKEIPGMQAISNIQ